MSAVGEHIHTTNAFDSVAGFFKERKISGQRGGFAGDIDKKIRLKIDDFKDRFGMNAVPGRIQDDDVGIVRELGDLFHDVTGNKMAIGEAVFFGIDFGGFHGFFNQFDTDDLLGDRGKDLSDGAGTAIEIEDIFSSSVPNVITDDTVKFFGTKGIGLEEGEG